jgi:iron complex outermembrane recepter protein
MEVHDRRHVCPNDRWAATLAARYSSRVYATIDNTEIYTHTYQGFDSFLVVDARVRWQIDPRASVALGVDNLPDERYFLFHPFPQQTVVAEVKIAL